MCVGKGSEDEGGVMSVNDFKFRRLVEERFVYWQFL